MNTNTLHLFKAVFMVMVLLILSVDIGQAQCDSLEQEPPYKTTDNHLIDTFEGQYKVFIGDSIILPSPKIPMTVLSKKETSYGIKICYYCINECYTVNHFASLCTDKLRQGNYDLPEGFMTISTDLIWAFIRNEKEPIGPLKTVIDALLVEGQYQQPIQTNVSQQKKQH